MGRNRFEDQFKEKLASREITPSSGSWEKLSGQLNSDGKKQGLKLWWIGVAATIIGAIFVAGLVYNSNKGMENPGIVETPAEEMVKDVTKVPLEEKKLAIEGKETQEGNSGNAEKTVVFQKKQTSQPVRNLEEENLMADVKEDNPSPAREYITDHHEIPEISQKLEEIIASVSLKEGDSGQPSNEEIDALLYKAASEISLERKNIKSAGKVDAGDLLFAVEMELEESFRDKIFDVLKEGYLKARTAVANRNYP